MWLACWGNPMEGFRFIGPFYDSTAATEFCEEYIYTDYWWVVSIQSVADFHKENEA